MPLNVIDLREFYLCPLGKIARRILRAQLQKIWPRIDGDKIATLGYGTPLLRPWLGHAERLLALMPRDQGVAYWPAEGANISCFADLESLPLEDEILDRVIVMHALETTQNPANLLHEVWRVLKNGGRAILIVPNRRGCWAHHDENPFGTGRPFSATQLKALVREQGFSVTTCARCLYMPPWRNKLALALSEKIERFCSFFLSKFGGVLVLEVEKQIFAPILVKSQTTQLRTVLPLSWTVSSGPLTQRAKPIP